MTSVECPPNSGATHGWRTGEKAGPVKHLFEGFGNPFRTYFLQSPEYLTTYFKFESEVVD